jgi:hypothetical protein
MKILLIHRDNLNNLVYTHYGLNNHAVCFFNHKSVRLYSIFHILKVSSSFEEEHKVLTFLNKELQLNGTIIRGLSRPHIIPSEEALFRLKLTILTYQEFEFEPK